MRHLLTTALGALALATAAPQADAAHVTLTGWAFGAPAEAVTVTRGAGTARSASQAVLAGAFTGSLSGTPGYDASPFITYCVELEEFFSFSRSAMTGYAVVPAGDYFQRRRGDAGIAERLGALLSWEADHQAARSASNSTALQLAIWNVVYDGQDLRLDSGQLRSSGSGFAATAGAQASDFLARAGGGSQFDVFVLEKAGSQDFLLLAPRSTPVPAPATLPLALVALGSVALAGMLARRRPAQGRRSA
jgi:hypothetical protein